MIFRRLKASFVINFMEQLVEMQLFIQCVNVIMKVEGNGAKSVKSGQLDSSVARTHARS